MTTYLTRQIGAHLYSGILSSIRDAKVKRGSMWDAPRKYQLALADGDVSSGNALVASDSTMTIPLPENYTNASRLGVFIEVRGVCKITIDSPTHGSDNETLIKGTRGTTDGEHPGFFGAQMDVNSITLTVDSSDDDILVSWFLYKIPADLTVASAWRDGARTIGRVTS